MCNALGEGICAERNIRTDSPAATKKVLEVSRALREAKVRVLVLSLGRGRQCGNGKLHRARVVRVEGVPVLYLPFLEVPLVTHIWTAISTLVALIKLRKKMANAVLLVYNRIVHYWPAIEFAGGLGYRCHLDLEDGEVQGVKRSARDTASHMLKARFDFACRHGALVAAEVIAGQYAGKRHQVCYGVADINPRPKSFVDTSELVVHLGGTLQQDTGADLLAGAIRVLRASEMLPLRFVITGMGNSANAFARLAEEPGWPRLEFLGRVNNEVYAEVLSKAHIGLALKLHSGQLGTTTFPSKVVEIASRNMLLVSTKVSDVPKLFGEDGAFFLDDETPEALAALLVEITQRRNELDEISQRGAKRVHQRCAQAKVGEALAKFFWPLSGNCDVRHVFERLG